MKRIRLAQVPPALILVAMGIWLLPPPKAQPRRTIHDWFTGIDFVGSASLLVSVSSCFPGALMPGPRRAESELVLLDRRFPAAPLGVRSYRRSLTPMVQSYLTSRISGVPPGIHLRRASGVTEPNHAPVSAYEKDQPIYRVDCGSGCHGELQHGIPSRNAFRDCLSATSVQGWSTSTS